MFLLLEKWWCVCVCVQRFECFFIDNSSLYSVLDVFTPVLPVSAFLTYTKLWLYEALSFILWSC